MAPPRKITRGTGAIEDDPERENRTHARAANPAASDPERVNKTQARAARPEVADDDPERANATQAKVPNPLKRRNTNDPERENKTQAKIRANVAAKRPEEDYDTAGEYADEAGAYRTGQNYQAASDEDLAGVSPSLSLEGDGLEALDPEVGSRTKALPALEVEESGGSGGEEAEEADDANATRAGPPLKLEIVGGPDAGKKKKFKGVRMVIGRTPGVDLQLSDQSVSRRHVELIYGDDGVLLKDLGSGNGTKVNGTKVAEKMLEHGDEIAIGKTKIKFVDELAAFKKVRDENEKKEADKKAAAEKKAEEKEEESEEEKKADKPAKTESGDKKPAGRQRPVRTSRQTGGDGGGFADKFKALPRVMRFGIVGGVVVVLLIFILGIAMRPPPPAPVDPAKILADAKMQEARNAVRDEDYARAAQLIEDAEKLQPGIDKTKLGPQAKTELAFRAALEDAKKAIGEKRFEDAKKHLDNAGKGSLKSEEARVKVRQELDVAELAYKKEKIEELIAAGEIDGAKRLLAELPVEMQSGPAEAIVEFERQLAEQNALDAKDAAAAVRNAAANRKAQREEEMNEAFVVVERKFAGAEWERASSECARVVDAYGKEKEIAARARKLQGLIPSFGRSYDEGMKKYRQGALAQAAKPLRVAHQLYGQIGLRANKFGPELEDKIGAAAVVAGKEALIRGDLVIAWQMFRDAAKFDPSDSKARAGLDDVTAKAELLFQDAYMTRDRDPLDAVRKFKVVVQVTDPGSTVHEKAKNQLAAMAP